MHVLRYSAGGMFCVGEECCNSGGSNSEQRELGMLRNEENSSDVSGSSA